MSFFDWGNPPINSTQTPQTNPSTSTLIAELDSTVLGTVNLKAGVDVTMGVTAVLGCSTNATFQLETATSTALNAAVDVAYIQTPTGQSGQYFLKFRVQKDYRIRVRINSTVTATATAFLSAEAVT